MWKYILLAAFSSVSNMIAIITMADNFGVDIIRGFSVFISGKHILFLTDIFLTTLKFTN